MHDTKKLRSLCCIYFGNWDKQSKQILAMNLIYRILENFKKI